MTPKIRIARPMAAAPQEEPFMPTTLAALRTVDLRAVEGPDPWDYVAPLFDALAPGDRFHVLAEQDLAPLLARLQKERPGLFEWSPFEEQPASFRVEIARRETGTGPREVTEALAWDHDRLEELERKAFEERAAGRVAEAARAYDTFARGLRRHIGFEEEILFPEFERRAGIPRDFGPTAVMRAEHREIEGLLEHISREIGDPAADADSPRRRLHEVLGAHNVKEERVLYPGTDRLLREDERDALVRRIQAYRR
jgi:regulator of cell morphogenesis and NO signaling